MKFRDWYESKHGKFPGQQGEEYQHIVERLCNACAEYVDESVNARMQVVEDELRAIKAHLVL